MAAPRVAVYIDFDNVVISRYDQLHAGRREAWRADNARDHTPDPGSDDPVAVKLARATVEVGALLDYAASFGTVALARAYADWSVPANAAYRRQLVDRAVDLVQLFPVSGTKNGADIRLSVDAMEDLTRYGDVTHVVIVGGDSDYIALAQRCKQLGRFVVGIGVAGSTSRALIAACDEFSSYDALPGVPSPAPAEKPVAPTRGKGKASGSSAEPTSEQDPASPADSGEQAAPARKTRRRRKPAEPDPQTEAGELLVRAITVAQAKADDGEWLFGGGVKSQMQRMDPSFKEKSLGYKSFSAFVDSVEDKVEARTDEDGHLRLRLRG
ncbi:NYN domain-containing protein [Nocardioides nanhaiensis]|uniref:NYN domain-containing protein n=1 Tax=Nocardioides nanhaiensis TaxID=1476871 RepID=A0ABP8VZ09_9ACTN